MLLHYSKLPPLTLCVQYECETKPTPTSTFQGKDCDKGKTIYTYTCKIKSTTKM